MIIVVLIYLVLPLAGFFSFLNLKKKMNADKIIEPPVFDFFIIFITYGGLVLVILTSLFWKWSGMASFGTFYLVLGAPITMGIVAYRQFKKREITTYHHWAFKLAIFYFVIAPMMFLGLYFADRIK